MSYTVETLGLNITLNLMMPNGYYIAKAIRVDAERTVTRYLSLSGNWSENCTNGWFKSRDEALRIFSAVMAASLTPVTNEDLRWEDRES